MTGLEPQVPVDAMSEMIVHINACGENSGLMILGNCEDQGILLLVDTGASISLMSRGCFKALGSKYKLQPAQISVHTVDDGEMNVYGKFTCDLRIGFVTVQHLFYVADMEAEMLLGLDFLNTHGCTIDLRGNHLKFKGQQVPFQTRIQHQSCCQVVLKDCQVIPPGGEIFCAAEVQGEHIPQVGAVEPGEIVNNLVIMAPSINCVQDGCIGIRLFNVGGEDTQLYKGMHLGKFQAPVAIGPGLEEDTLPRPTAYCNNVTTEEPLMERRQVPEHLQDMFERSMIELPEEEIPKLVKLLQGYEDVFMKTGEPLPGTTLTTHFIDTGSATPIRQPPRRTPYHQKPTVEAEVKKMLEEGIIEPAGGPWASPIVLVKKKDGSTRFCVDYRKVNDLRRKDVYPIPRIDDTLDMLSGAKYFSTLDLASGYWQVPVEEKDRDKTAFTTHIGLFRFNRMPFGLCNAPSTFERLMEQVLKGLQWQVCLLYLDDIIIFSQDVNEHLARLTAVFERIRAANLRMKPKKCQLFQLEVEYLGRDLPSRSSHSRRQNREGKRLANPTEPKGSAAIPGVDLVL